MYQLESKLNSTTHIRWYLVKNSINTFYKKNKFINKSIKFQSINSYLYKKSQIYYICIYLNESIFTIQ